MKKNNPTVGTVGFCLQFEVTVVNFPALEIILSVPFADLTQNLARISDSYHV